MVNLAQAGPYHYSEVTFWYVAIGIGFTVVLVVIALLTMLYRLVQEIDNGVVGVENVLARTSNNTSATFNIPLIAGAVDAILNEGLQHHLFLTRVMTGGRVAGQSGGGRKSLGGRLPSNQ